MSKLASVLSDKDIISCMDDVRDICSKLSDIRARNDVRNRQPLQQCTIVDPNGKYSYLAVMPELVQIIRDEVNVKQVFLHTNNYHVELNPREENE